MFDRVAQKRFQKLPKPSSASFASPARLAPKVIYGKRSRPLPLQGTQFSRQDTYSLPSDDDDEQEGDFMPFRKGPPRSKRREPDPEDSPLSEDELEAVYPSNASPILSTSSSPVLPASSSKTGLDPDRSSSSARKRTARLTTKAAEKSHHSPSQDVPKAVVATRLPVNELLLLPVRSDQPITAAARNDDSHHEDNDPISNTTSSGQKEFLSPPHDDSDENLKAPLTTIRKRLKTPKFSHKYVETLRKKQKRRMSMFQSSDETSKLGDGFESSELKVDHRLVFAKRQRRIPKSLLLRFSALQLQPGPLPDVKFESSSSELQLGAVSEGQGYHLAQQEDDRDTADRDRPFTRDVKPRVSFSDRVLSEVVRAELSSISAPRRPISVSSDESESDSQDLGDSDGEANEEANEDEISQDGAEPNAESEHSAPTPPSNQRAQSHNRFLRRSPPPERVSKASTPARSLDRRIGHLPRTLSSGSRMIEVDEAIVDNSDEASTTSRPLLHTDLTEVDDMILDDVDSELPGIGANEPICSREHDMLDEMEGSIDARSYVDPPPRPHRPRSILRNPSSRFKSRDTRPEDTAANTHRNSTRQIESESHHFPPSASRRRTTAIDLEPHEHSRYFSAAATMLHQPQPQNNAQPHPTIIKLRSNYFARQASHRGDSVQVYDSEAQMPETSPEPPDYTNSTSSQLKVLRRGRGATWTRGESLPREPPKDLKALTRTVSREYGTLSQSVKRRPSLPFQSPMKIR